MNKTIKFPLTILIIFGFILPIGVSSVLAETTTPEYVDVKATINSDFGFTIRDKSQITFAVSPGHEQVGSHEIAIDCRSNHGVPWTLSVAGGPLTSAASGAEISNSNFLFWHTVNINTGDPASPHGTLIPSFGSTQAMSESGQIVYESSADEGVDAFIGIGIGLKIVVPAGTQAADDYSTTISITMTDSY